MRTIGHIIEFSSVATYVVEDTQSRNLYTLDLQNHHISRSQASALHIELPSGWVQMTVLGHWLRAPTVSQQQLTQGNTQKKKLGASLRGSRLWELAALLCPGFGTA